MTINSSSRRMTIVSPSRRIPRAPKACLPSNHHPQVMASDNDLSSIITTSAPEPEPVVPHTTLSMESTGIGEPSNYFPQCSVGDANSWAICKVPYRLREVNKEAYEPNMISIGPYHYGKEHLRTMEVIKRSCFDKIVEETKVDFSGFQKTMKTLEERIRECYIEPFYLNSNHFVEMIYDGCFIVQLIRKIYPKDLNKLGRGIQNDILCDLLLLENQLPFFVLFELYRKIMGNGGGDLNEFARSALSFFKIGGQRLEIKDPSPKNDIKHFLDLVHNCFRPSPRGIKQHQEFKAKAKQPKSQRSWKFMRNAAELEEAGINFFGKEVQDHDQDQGLFDIEFTVDTKELRIPTLHVDDYTERFFRNFIAYEQFIPSGQPTYVSDYVVFMDNLINTGKDVQILCNSGIIDNWLGDDEAVAQMFNKLRNFICSPEDFYYAEIFGRLNEHCQRKWNKYKAKLNKDYFNSPWSFISFLAAVALLLLTLLQTIFSVFSSFHH